MANLCKRLVDFVLPTAGAAEGESKNPAGDELDQQMGVAVVFDDENAGDGNDGEEDEYEVREIEVEDDDDMDDDNYGGDDMDDDNAGTVSGANKKTESSDKDRVAVKGELVLPFLMLCLSL